MARDTCVEAGFAGQVGHGRESRGQGLGRGPVFDHNRGLEQHDELIDPGLVVKTTFEVVQHWV